MSVRSHLAVVTALAFPALFALAPGSAAAQGSTGELLDEDYQHRIAGELGIYQRSTGGNSLVMVQPGLHAAIGIVAAEAGGPGVQLDIDWRGGGYVNDPELGDSQSAFRVFNPYVGARVAFGAGEPGSRWRARVGGGVTLPLANAYDGNLDLLLAGYGALAMTGGWDPWLNSAGNMAVVARGDFEYRHQYFLVGAETSLGFMLPVEWEGRTGDTIVVPQLGIWAAARPIEQLAIGGRFQAVAQITTGDVSPGASNAEGFLAFTPFIRAELGGGFIETRLVINLDEPFGFAFDHDRFWGFYIAGGASF